MAITASMVKELRDATGAGMMECKKALTETDGNMDAAVDNLRKKGLAAVAKKAGRATNEGAIIALVSDDTKLGALVEVNCETDFVAMNDKFKAYATRIAKAVLNNKPANIDELQSCKDGNETVEDIITDAIHVLGENIKVSRFVIADGNVVSSYVHGVGKIGVLVQFETDLSADKFSQCGKDVAMQVAAANPISTTRDDVPEDVVNHEMDIYKAQAAESGKPDFIQEKIALGRMNKFYKERCLTEQVYVKDPDTTVQKYVDSVAKELGGSIKITGFERFELGE